MKRFTSETKVSNNEIRYRTRIEDDESIMGSEESRHMQYNFVKALVDQWMLVSCGFDTFQQLKIFHNGKQWVAEAETVS